MVVIVEGGKKKQNQKEVSVTGNTYTFNGRFLVHSCSVKVKRSGKYVPLEITAVDVVIKVDTAAVVLAYKKRKTE